MLQRKQSLYLLLMAIICMIMVIVDMPISSGNIKMDKNYISYEVSINGTNIKTNHNVTLKNYNLIALLIISSLLSFVTIFLFKKQALQLKIVMINFLILGLSMFYMLYYHYQLIHAEGITMHITKYSFTLILPVLLVLLNILAFRGIKKDIELLASVDRLR